MDVNNFIRHSDIVSREVSLFLWKNHVLWRGVKNHVTATKKADDNRLAYSKSESSATEAYNHADSATQSTSSAAL